MRHRPEGSWKISKITNAFTRRWISAARWAQWDGSIPFRICTYRVAQTYVGSHCRGHAQIAGARKLCGTVL